MPMWTRTSFPDCTTVDLGKGGTDVRTDSGEWIDKMLEKNDEIVDK